MPKNKKKTSLAEIKSLIEQYDKPIEDGMCCICGKRYEGDGNCSYAYTGEPDSPCCDYCHKTIVVPESFRILQEKLDGTYIP